MFDPATYILCAWLSVWAIGIALRSFLTDEEAIKSPMDRDDKFALCFFSVLFACFWPITLTLGSVLLGIYKLAPEGDDSDG